MKTVWKYDLDMAQTHVLIQWKGIYELMIPENAEFLSVREQHGKPCLWFLVNPENKQEKRKFIIIGTGKHHNNEQLPIKKFLGTFFLNEGYFVGHIFEVLA